MIDKLINVGLDLVDESKTICNSEIDMSLLNKKINKTYYGELEILNVEGD